MIKAFEDQRKKFKEKQGVHDSRGFYSSDEDVEQESKILSSMGNLHDDAITFADDGEDFLDQDQLDEESMLFLQQLSNPELLDAALNKDGFVGIDSNADYMKESGAMFKKHVGRKIRADKQRRKKQLSRASTPKSTLSGLSTPKPKMSVKIVKDEHGEKKEEYEMLVPSPRCASQNMNTLIDKMYRKSKTCVVPGSERDTKYWSR